MTDFSSPFRLRNPNMTLKERFLHLSWCYIFLIFLVAFSGFVVLYAAANGNWEPWANRQFSRFWLGCAVMFVVAMIDLRFWLKYAYVFTSARLFCCLSWNISAMTPWAPSVG